MDFIPCPYTAQAEIRYTWQDVLCENVLYFKASVVPNSTNLASLANKLDDWWYARLRLTQCQSVYYRETFVKSLHEEDGLSALNSDHTGEHGNYNTGGYLPVNVTLAVSFRTGTIGRSYRGRNYFIGLRAGMLSGNYVVSGNAAAIVEAYEYLLVGGDLAGSGWTWVVCSRRHNKAWREEGVMTTINAVTVTDLTVDTRRGRLP